MPPNIDAILVSVPVNIHGPSRLYAGDVLTFFLCLHYSEFGSHLVERQAMEAKKKRLTLDLDPAFQRRLKVIAALKGVSMRRYCQTAIDRELTKDEAEGVSGRRFDRQSFERVVERREQLFGGRPLPGDSVDLIREARELRDDEVENWS